MTTIEASAERAIAAPADRVYRILADYRQHHPAILPDAISDLTVEEGGVGAGTVIRFRTTMAGRSQHYHQRVEEPDPGRVLVERDVDGDLATTFTVTPTPEGSHVRIATRWTSSGLRGMIERLLAPRFLQAVYADELERLDRYTREHPEI